MNELIINFENGKNKQFTVTEVRYEPEYIKFRCTDGIVVSYCLDVIASFNLRYI